MLVTKTQIIATEDETELFELIKNNRVITAESIADLLSRSEFKEYVRVPRTTAMLEAKHKRASKIIRNFCNEYHVNEKRVLVPYFQSSAGKFYHDQNRGAHQYLTNNIKIGLKQALNNAALIKPGLAKKIESILGDIEKA